MASTGEGWISYCGGQCESLRESSEELKKFVVADMAAKLEELGVEKK